MKEIQHGNEHECKETGTFYVLSITSSSSTNFNNNIFECSSEEGKTTHRGGSSVSRKARGKSVLFGQAYWYKTQGHQHST